MGETTSFIIGLTRAVEGFLQDQLLPIATVLAVLMIVWAGFLYIQTNPEEGKKALTAVIAGILIIGLAAVLIATLQQVATSGS